MTHLDSYTEILKILHTNQIPFAVSGTFALYLQNEKFAHHYELNDCDIFLEYSENALASFIALMREHDWKVTVWEEDLKPGELLEQVAGKFYLRCRKGHLVLDATYDYEREKFGDRVADLIHLNGLPVIKSEKVIEGKKHRGTPRDLLAIDVFARTLNPAWRHDAD